MEIVLVYTAQVTVDIAIDITIRIAIGFGFLKHLQDLLKELKVPPQSPNFPKCLKFPDFSGSSFGCITAIMRRRIFTLSMVNMKSLLRSRPALSQANFQDAHGNAVLEWYEIHKEALLRDWELAEQRKPLEPIQPLE